MPASEAQVCKQHTLLEGGQASVEEAGAGWQEYRLTEACVV